MFAQYWILTGAGFALAALQSELAQPAVIALFLLIAGSMYVAGLWLEHRRERFWVDGVRNGLMLGVSLWLPQLSQNVEGWILGLQALGTANMLLLITLYWFQQDEKITPAAS